jgi:type IX secretion system PorP/SprF family membrane protein
MDLFTWPNNKILLGKMRFKLNILKGLFIFISILYVNIVCAQKDPMFTQYNFNTQVYNPAYAGSWKSLGFIVLGRNQWTGMEGAPQTYTLSIQTNTKNNKVGLGLNVISDKIGLEKQLGVYGDYSYGFQVTENSLLRLGLKFGFSNYNNKLTQYTQYPGVQDPALQADIDSRYLLNFGVGAFLQADNYYVGFSVPKILKNTIENNFTNLTQNDIRNIFFVAGYVLPLSEYLQFKPTFLTKAAIGESVQFDLSANFLLHEKVWLGAMYRTGESFGIIAQWIFDKKLRIGYSFDFTTSDLQRFNNGTHEVMVSYEIGVKRKIAEPRMF